MKIQIKKIWLVPWRTVHCRMVKTFSTFSWDDKETVICCVDCLFVFFLFSFFPSWLEQDFIVTVGVFYRQEEWEMSGARWNDLKIIRHSFKGNWNWNFNMKEKSLMSLEWVWHLLKLLVCCSGLFRNSFVLESPNFESGSNLKSPVFKSESSPSH